MMKAAVLGATGSVGQIFVQLLNGHPWFKVSAVAASESSAGRKYSEVAKWRLPTSIPEEAAELDVVPVEPEAVRDVDVVFSALPAEIAGKTEEDFAKAGYVVVGRVRKDLALGGVRFIALGHNTVRGDAGCGILNAEYLKVKNTSRR